MANWNWQDLKAKARHAFDQASQAFDKAKIFTLETWDEGRLAFWTNQIGKEDALKAKALVDEAAPLYDDLQNLVAAIHENPAKHGVEPGAFMAQVNERIEKGPLNSPFPERRAARNCRLAAQSLFQKGDTAPVYAQVLDLATRIETLYKQLPASYVARFEEWEQTRKDAGAKAGELRDHLLTRGQKGIAAIREKLEL